MLKTLIKQGLILAKIQSAGGAREAVPLPGREDVPGKAFPCSHLGREQLSGEMGFTDTGLEFFREACRTQQPRTPW